MSRSSACTSRSAGCSSATVNLPERFAAYIARSARLSSSCRRSGRRSRDAATPMLAWTRSVRSTSDDRLGAARRGCRRRAPAASPSSSMQHAELVAAEPGHACRRCGRVALSRSATATQQCVAGVVAEGVVDRLEVVEVEKQHGQRAERAAVQLERVAEPVGEQRPVGQPGQRVVEGAGAAARPAAAGCARRAAVVEHQQVLPGEQGGDSTAATSTVIGSASGASAATTTTPTPMTDQHVREPEVDGEDDAGDSVWASDCPRVEERGEADQQEGGDPGDVDRVAGA